VTLRTLSLSTGILLLALAGCSHRHHETQTFLTPVIEEDRVVGIQVSEIAPGSIFANAGIESGDVILSINGFPVESLDANMDSFLENIGDVVALRIRSANGVERDVSVKPSGSP